MSTEEMAKLISEAGFGAVDYSLMAMVHPDYIYNGANYIPATLDSVLASTYKQFEIICMEDFSTDNSKDILKENML